MAEVIARISGTAIKPGISKNGRLYTREAIGKAVDRAQQRLAEGSEPLTMLTHHGAEDDSTRIAGGITKIWQDTDGSAKYEAAIANTDHGRTIAQLTDTSNGKKPMLRGVSIRGAWAGNVQRVNHEGRAVETSDDLELDGLDFTRKPGVTGAGVEDFTWTQGAPTESATGRVLIYESAPEAEVTDVAEEADVESSTTVTGNAVEEAKPKASRHVFENGRCTTCGY